jgi:hypothetical protein
MTSIQDVFVANKSPLKVKILNVVHIVKAVPNNFSNHFQEQKINAMTFTLIQHPYALLTLGL